MPDLLVSIPSRDRPNELMRTVAMLYSTCSDRNNFDLQIITDFDQEELYRDIRLEFDQFIWCGVEYCGHWLNLMNKQHDYFLASDYYFMWYLPDDLRGLREGWDVAILEKKKAFKDDLFVLYTDGATKWGRNKEQHENCYTGGLEALDVHDPNPIWTKKWCEFIAPLFYPPSKYVVYRELIIAAILRLLYEKGINRNVHSKVYYTEAINDGRSAQFNQPWYDLIWNDFDDIRPIVAAMAKYIEDSKTHQKHAVGA
ncbi:hypothetical protein LCGC14_1195640 [marine sediment metagenome]|uniref:Glycosyltransferase 2-like domain-containing protein n=1 Tax=marine sediment metagenome TaxID=412755 RepID=A0A0F9LIJ4_9ZZZZ